MRNLFIMFFTIILLFNQVNGDDGKNSGRLKNDDIADAFLPKTQLVYSFIYSYNLDKGYDYSKFEDMKNNNQKFERLYEEHINDVLIRIPEYSGFDWEDEIIEIYPVTGGESFTSPLTVKHYDDQEFMFFLLIHELAHHNMGGVFPSVKLQEAMADRVAYYVIKEFSSEIADKWEKSSYYAWQNIYDFDLAKYTVADWLDQNMNELIKAQNKFFEAKMMRAHKGYKKAIKMYRNISDEYFWNEFGVEAYFRIAEIYHMDLDDYKNAIEEYLYFTELFPNSEYTAEAYYKMGQIYKNELRNDQAALAAYQQIIRYQKRWNTFIDDATVRIADYYYENEDYIRAIDEYWLMVDRFPRGWAKGEAYLGLGRAYTKLGLWERALKMFHNAIVEMKDKQNLLYPEVLFELGQVYEIKGEVQNAQLYYFKILANHVNSGHYLSALNRVKDLLH